jgi:hypothetical protein
MGILCSTADSNTLQELDGSIESMDGPGWVITIVILSEITSPIYRIRPYMEKHSERTSDESYAYYN